MWNEAIVALRSVTIEDLNAAIKKHVQHHVSETQVDQLIANRALLEEIQQELRELLYANRADVHWRGRNVRADIDNLKEFFRKNIGRTWAQATRKDTTLRVVDGPSRGGSAAKPWKEVEAIFARTGREAAHEYVREYVVRMTPYFNWAL